jgi:hypothetical protein
MLLSACMSQCTGYWPDNDEYYEATVLHVCHKKTKLLHLLEFDDEESRWIDLCEHKFRVYCLTDNEIHDGDLLTWASNYDSLELESEAKVEECVTKCGIKKEANPHEKQKTLSEGCWGSIAREGRRTADREILPRFTPKKNADGTCSASGERPPLGFFWDPSRGLFAPESMKVKEL